jgi:Spy/CpxP family protein refolding chaperone
MIQLEGLTERQRQLADLIWACDTQEALDLLLRAMPPEYRRDAETVHELMLAAVFDQQMEIREDVKDFIDHCSRP